MFCYDDKTRSTLKYYGHLYMHQFPWKHRHSYIINMYNLFTYLLKIFYCHGAQRRLLPTLFN